MIKSEKFASLLRKVGGVLVMAIGLFLLVLLVINGLRDIPLWFFGRHVDGVVEEKEYQVVDEESSELIFTYSIGYRFTSEKGDTYKGSSGAAALEWSAFSPGDAIPIVYSPIDPNNNRLDDSRYVPFLLCTYIPFVFMMWFFLVAGWRVVAGEFKTPDPKPWIKDRNPQPE